ncbi:hypothetical protein [Pajaroellobacter abortibovis]|uniref:Uncharacterized protein n=1 Tax=Pajaroellobacter abortibovis TaxID=1882918 RepID=A0A1L6MVJ4_9BACT|nr:hypothetical protein [Pajaroellobacter abortibovis]APR99521.1 hypothetical protein BCY86_01625 [Pajaroellobacter abortibovis]
MKKPSFLFFWLGSIALPFLVNARASEAQVAVTNGKSAAADAKEGYGYTFSDDPLMAGGLSPNDAKIRVRSGPVRTLLIRPRSSFIPAMLKSVENL